MMNYQMVRVVASGEAHRDYDQAQGFGRGLPLKLPPLTPRLMARIRGAVSFGVNILSHVPDRKSGRMDVAAEYNC